VAGGSLLETEATHTRLGVSCASVKCRGPIRDHLTIAAPGATAGGVFVYVELNTGRIGGVQLREYAISAAAI